MANGIEVRVPFQDGELAGFAMGLPSRHKARWGNRKRVLRAALRGIVPDDILDGPKTGFGVPCGHWLKTSLRDLWNSVVLAPEMDVLFDLGYLKKIQAEHLNGVRDRSELLWKALNLAIWYNKFRPALVP